MAEVTWAELAKAIGDLTTIVEYVAAELLAHNLDPSAHGQANEAVYMHRISDILDHMDGSVTTDKIDALAVTSDKITGDQIVGKDIRTATNVGSGTSGVKMTSAGIEMWLGTVQKVGIPVSGNPFFNGDLSVEQLSYLKDVIKPSFESLDAYNTTLVGVSSAITPYVSSMHLRAGKANNDAATLRIIVGVLEYNTAGDYNPVAEAVIGQDSSMNCEWGFAIGASDPLTPDTNSCGFRWKQSDTTLKCFWLGNDAADHTHTLSTPDMSDQHKYRIENSLGGDTIKFYIDDVLVYTVTTGGLIDSDVRVSAKLKNHIVGDYSDMMIKNLLYYQDYP